MRNADEETLASVERVAQRASDALAEAAAPGDMEQVTNLLIPFAEMLDCNVPGEEGLALMEAALAFLPASLFDTAKVRVAQTHRYRRLPVPADFLKAVGGELAYLEQQRSSAAAQLNFIKSIRAQRVSQQRIVGHD